MSLRGVGGWIADRWNSIKDGFGAAATENFWDWPLWLSIPVGVGVPWLVIWLIVNHIHETRGQRASFWGSLGFTAGGLLCAYVTYDVWFGWPIFDGDHRSLRLMRIAYPVMTLVFGVAGLIGFASRRR